MRNKYREASVAELEESHAIVEIQDGNHGEKHPTAADYVDEGIPFIMANDLSLGVVDIQRCHFITEDTARRLRIGFSITGDVLLTHKGTLGNVAVVEEADPFIMLTPQVTYYRTDGKLLHNRYLSYAFRDPSFQARMRASGGQGTRPYIGIRAQRRLRITFPELAIQQRIAEVLSPYDELIENNRRRMGLLEEGARLLYREWFVRLRFPGHEHTRITNGVPQGWGRVRTPEAIEINPSTKLSDEEGHWYVEMADLPTDSMVIQNAIRRHGRSGSKFRNGDTLFARITPCLENGKTGFVNFMVGGEAGRGSTEFIVLRSKRVTPEFVYCLARTYHFRENAIKSMVGSSGRQRVQESCFEKFMVWIPPRSVLNLFSDFAEPVFRQISVLHSQNQKLRTARDLLLPRLMSGEITI